MTATSSAGEPRCNNRGFALLELVLVLAILGLMAGVVFPRAARAPGPAELRAVADQIAFVLRTDRNAALRERREIVTRIDVPQGIVASGATGRRVHIPAGVDVQLLQSSRESRPDGGAIRFRADGRSSGGVLRLRRGGASYQIAVNWLTAGVLVAARDPARLPEATR